MKPRHVFADDGNIYVVTFDGDLLWYKDANRNGTPGWATGSGNRIGNDWLRMRHAFAGGNGVIYAVTQDGDLLWYEDVNRNGTPGWAAGSGNRIGSDWTDVRYVPPLTALGHGAYTVNGRPALGTRRLLVVLAEYTNTPQREFPPFPTTGAHSPGFYDQVGFGSPQPPFSTTNPVNPASLTGFHLENSSGRFRWVRAGQGLVGPVSMGAWSDTLSGDPKQRAANILNRVSQDRLVRLTDEDLDGDGTVAFDELCVLLVENYDRPAPFQPANRHNNPIQVTDFNFLGIPSTKTVCVKVAFVGPRTPFYQIAHETSHSLGLSDTSDLRGYNDENSMLTVMSGYSFQSDDQISVHLDAFHKHVLGWVDPRVYTLGTPSEVTIPVTDASRVDAPILLWDPGRGTGNYFLLEYRTPTSPQGLAYDADVGRALAAAEATGAPQSGLAIWRVPGISNNGRTTEHLGATSLLPAGRMLWQPGQITPELTWPDGTTTGVRIRVGPIDGQRGSIQIAWWSNRFPLYVYGVQPDGQLSWYPHDGYLIGGGLESWGAMKVVGNGWQGLSHVFPANNGIIYAITRSGEMRWYKHTGYEFGGGLETWEPQDTGYRPVGTGWAAVQHLFAMNP
jgi:M6 family metalloprotease-like protein